jgi:hypothetical protein
MKNIIIEKIAQEAINNLKKIIIPDGYRLNVNTVIISDPNVWYEYKDNGFYEVIEERGVKRELVIAKTHEEMHDYFIHAAIKEYAHRYELDNRIRFENNNRQIDKIMDACYESIGYTRRFVKEEYNDDIHIALDLLKEYKRIANTIQASSFLLFHSKKSKVNIEYIANGYYSNQSGGILDVNLALEIVRSKLFQIFKYSKKMEKVFLKYEEHYRKIRMIAYPSIGQKSIKVEAKEIELKAEIEEYKKFKDYIYLKCVDSYIVDKYGNLIQLNSFIETEQDIINELNKIDYSCPFKDGEVNYNRLLLDSVLPTTMSDPLIQKYFCLRILFDIYTKRNLDDDIERLVEFVTEYTALDYNKFLYKLIVGNWYGVFPYGASEKQKEIIERMNNINAFDGFSFDK